MNDLNPHRPKRTVTNNDHFDALFTKKERVEISAHGGGAETKVGKYILDPRSQDNNIIDISLTINLNINSELDESTFEKTKELLRLLGKVQNTRRVYR